MGHDAHQGVQHGTVLEHDVEHDVNTSALGVGVVSNRVREQDPCVVHVSVAYIKEE